jgi:hypothetical protein
MSCQFLTVGYGQHLSTAVKGTLPVLRHGYGRAELNPAGAGVQTLASLLGIGLRTFHGSSCELAGDG